MSIDDIVSSISKGELNNVEQRNLKNILFYVLKDGHDKLDDLFGQYLPSELKVLNNKNMLTSEDVFTFFVNFFLRKRKDPESLKQSINIFMQKFADKSRTAQKRVSERKSSYRSKLSENIDRKYAPGGPGAIKAKNSFYRSAKKHSEMTIGGKRTKHKRHKTNKTRRRRQSQTGR